MRRATPASDRWPAPNKFQSTLSMRRATGIFAINPHGEAISIHALHEESDFKWINLPPYIDISIHALHEESDFAPLGQTSPLTISIHALHEESDRHWSHSFEGGYISIHALHEESDRQLTKHRSSHRKFQSTLSMRRATNSTSPPKC